MSQVKCIIILFKSTLAELPKFIMLTNISGYKVFFCVIPCIDHGHSHGGGSHGHAHDHSHSHGTNNHIHAHSHSHGGPGGSQLMHGRFVVASS